MTNIPQPLVIKEAKNGIIKLSDVPEGGATALIPPGRLDEFEGVTFFAQVVIDGVPTGEIFTAETPYSKIIEIKVPKEILLRHVGPQGAEFSYILNVGGNEDLNPYIKYEITH